MKFSRYLSLAALVLLCACSDSHRPVYSGHQESTEGVPGFVNGRKTTPYAKLGQSYTVDGEEYTPRLQPDYVEEGMASWYGPGFHGGKTANGEVFDSNELTGAHRTLPLPSIVRVTMLSTGKSAYVRINDRGPFAHSRILDLSRAAADKIGLLRAGVAKVRIEYLPKESQRFADLLGQGRDPKSIDLASEVIGYGGSDNAQYAQTDVRANTAEPAENTHVGSFWDNFGSSPANAAEPTPEAAIEALKTPPSNETMSSAPVSDVVSNDLAAPRSASANVPFKSAKAYVPPPHAPVAPAPAPADSDNSPFAPVESADVAPARTVETASYMPSSLPPRTAVAAAAPVSAGGSFVQLGAFSNQGNAERLRSKYKDIADLQVVPLPNAAGQTLFHVRVGPYTTSDASMAVRDKLNAAGADAHIVKD